MIFFEPNQNCMSKMFMLSDSILSLVRLNKVRSTSDWLVSIPLKIYKVVDRTIEAFNMCATSDPNWNYTPPFYVEASRTKPVYDKEFYSKLVSTAISLITGTLSQMSNFDYFFFGKLVSYYFFSGAFLTYNLGYFYL